MAEFYSGLEHQPFQLGQGPVGALLLHGFPGTPAEMRPLGEQLATAGWAVYGPLLPGFGSQIATLGQKTRHDWLAAAHDQWQKVQAAHETAVLIGFSMGGALALNLAAQVQPHFLVLLAPFWRFAGWQGKLLPIAKYFKKTLHPFADADFTDTAVRKQLSEVMPGADLDDPAVQAQIRQQVQLPTKTIDEVRQLGQSGGKLANAVHCPTLVLQGQNDAVVPPTLTRQLIARLGGPVAYREVPGDHTFPKMQPPNSYNIAPDILNFVTQQNNNSTAAAAQN
ncbi:MAG: alpha/beta fold hydrolase [Ardenticatenaceae bacterium]|nr:alpha/beta fold hydrolase [Ardenticatenaceae bacterium]